MPQKKKPEKGSRAQLSAGDPAPPFKLPGPKGEVSLASHAGKYVVLYFYPRDKTPGCTREGQAFSKATAAFAKEGAVVLGVSKDSLASHASFADTCGITVPLLSDPDLTVHRAYGAYGEKTSYGKTTLGTIRSTFVIGPAGSIVRAFSNVKVDGHDAAVLQAIREHRTGGGKDPKPPTAGRAASSRKGR